MKQGYAILGAIVVAGMLLLSGCIGSDGGGFVVNKVVEAQKNVKQYTFESEIIIYKVPGMEAPVTMPMNGKVDVENKKMYINISTAELYLIGGEMYIKQAEQWIKMTKSDLEQGRSGMSGFEDLAKQYEKTVEILKSSQTKIDVVGEESVDGVVCYKVNVVPDAEKLKEQISENSTVPGIETINVSSYTVYVDKATNFIKKEDANFDIDISVRGMKMKINGQMKFVYNGINKQIDIQLPEEPKTQHQ